MENFTPISSLLGGLLVGLASAVLLVFDGRIAGISGITGGVLRLTKGDTGWRTLFVSGLIVGGFVYGQIAPGAFQVSISRSTGALLLAGVLVGIGTQMGNGCTSGHGICGLSRFSVRSLVAVLTFMTTAAVTVWLVGSVWGGVV